MRHHHFHFVSDANLPKYEQNINNSMNDRRLKKNIDKRITNIAKHRKIISY